MPPTLRIATRRSRLALWQAEHVQARIRAALPDHDVTLVPIHTEGDRAVDKSLAAIGGKGLFLKELEAAMLADEADLAVHSMKDVPAQLPDGFSLPLVLAPGSPFDAFVCNDYATPEALPEGARLGTSSLRRAAMLQRLRPDLQVAALRGNVQTRLAKLDAGEYDAIVLACAGLERLGLESRIRCRLTPEQCLPAIGQGVLGVEIRADDNSTLARIAALDDEHTHLRVAAERAVNARLAGSCHLPIAAFAEHDGRHMRLRACVAAPDGSRAVHDEIEGSARDGGQLGAALAERMLAAGADRILAQLT